MQRLGKRQLLIYVVLAAMLVFMFAACSDAALFGLIKSRSSSRSVQKHSLIVFPFDKDPDGAANLPDNFGKDVADYLRSTLSKSKDYATLLYSYSLMPIQRAKSDNVVKESDMKSPFFADKAKADKLAGIMSSDYYIVGSVESYTYDSKSKTVDLALKADLVMTKTGKVMQQFMVGGSAAAGDQAMEEDELVSIAAGKAVEALGAKILSVSSVAAKTAPTKAKK